MVRSLALLLALMMTGCSVVPAPVANASAGSLISREQAIANALKIASSSAPEISGALTPPQNIEAAQITLGQALQRMNPGSAVPKGYLPDAAVWYVTMDGLWANQMPAPGLTVTQVPYHHYFIVLDAVTGLSIETWLKP